MWPTSVLGRSSNLSSSRNISQRQAPKHPASSLGRADPVKPKGSPTLGQQDAVRRLQGSGFANVALNILNSHNRPGKDAVRGP